MALGNCSHCKAQSFLSSYHKNSQASPMNRTKERNLENSTTLFYRWRNWGQNKWRDLPRVSWAKEKMSIQWREGKQWSGKDGRSRMRTQDTSPTPAAHQDTPPLCGPASPAPSDLEEIHSISQFNRHHRYPANSHILWPSEILTAGSLRVPVSRSVPSWHNLGSSTQRCTHCRIMQKHTSVLAESRES